MEKRYAVVFIKRLTYQIELGHTAYWSKPLVSQRGQLIYGGGYEEVFHRTNDEWFFRETTSYEDAKRISNRFNELVCQGILVHPHKV